MVRFIRKGIKRQYLIKSVSVLICLIFFMQQCVFAAEDALRPSSFLTGEEQATKGAFLSPEDIYIPPELAQSEKRHIFPGSELIINLQDCHSSLSAQYSIVNILENLFRNYDLELVALEGASGYIDTSLLGSLPSKEIRKRTASALMKKGTLSAGEFFSVMNGSSVALYGVEDSRLYRKNVQDFRRIYEKNGENLRFIRSISRLLKEKEREFYGEDLERFVFKRRLHNRGDISFEVYAGIALPLCEKYGVDTSSFDCLRSFLEVIEREKQVDFEAAAGESKELLGDLMPLSSRKELEKMVLMTLNFSKDRTGPVEYHDWLFSFAAEKGIDTDEFAALSEYVEYARQYHHLDLIGLEKDLSSMETSLLSRLFRGGREEELYETAEAIRLTGALFKLELSRPQVAFLREFLDNIDTGIISGLCSGKDNALPARSFEERFAHVREAALEALSFYETARRRDAAMFENTVKRMRQENCRVAALISGGHHSSGLSGLMTEEKISHFILMPRYHSDKERPYVAVLTRKTAPYRDLVGKGAYDLALEAYFDSGDARRFHQMIALVCRDLFLEDPEGLRERLSEWAESYAAEYEKVRKERSKDLRYSPVAPETLKEIFMSIAVRSVDKGDCLVEIAGEEYIVSRDGVALTSYRGTEGTEKMDTAQRGPASILSEIRERLSHDPDEVVTRMLSNGALPYQAGPFFHMLYMRIKEYTERAQPRIKRGGHIFKNGRLNAVDRPLYVVHELGPYDLLSLGDLNTRKNRIRALERSIDAAVDKGARMLSVSAQMTRDGRFVNHWGKVKVGGVDRCLFELTLDDFSRSMGSNNVILLEELMEAARGRVGLKIDMKFWSHDIRGDSGEKYQDIMVPELLGLIKEKSMEDDVCLVSYKDSYLKKVRSRDENIALGLTVSMTEDMEDVLLQLNALIASAREIGAFSVSLYPEQLSPKITRKINEAGLELIIKPSSERIPEEIWDRASMIFTRQEELLDQKPRVAGTAEPKEAKEYVLPEIPGIAWEQVGRETFEAVRSSDVFARLKNICRFFPVLKAEHACWSRHRHTERVAKVAMDIAGELSTPESVDMKKIELLSLCHDLGRAPFSKIGEKILKEKGFDFDEDKALYLALYSIGVPLPRDIPDEIARIRTKSGELSEEVKVIIIADQLVSGLESIIYGYRSDYITDEDIPDKLLEGLGIVDFRRFSAEAQNDFNEAIRSKIINFVKSRGVSTGETGWWRKVFPPEITKIKDDVQSYLWEQEEAAVRGAYNVDHVIGSLLETAEARYRVADTTLSEEDHITGQIIRLSDAQVLLLAEPANRGFERAQWLAAKYPDGFIDHYRFVYQFLENVPPRILKDESYSKFLMKTAYEKAIAVVSDSKQLHNGFYKDQFKKGDLLMLAYRDIRRGISKFILDSLVREGCNVKDELSFHIDIPVDEEDISVVIDIKSIEKAGGALDARTKEDVSERLDSFAVSPLNEYTGIFSIRSMAVKGYAAYYDTGEDMDIGAIAFNFIPNAKRYDENYVKEVTTLIEEKLQAFENRLYPVIEQLDDESIRKDLEKVLAETRGELRTGIVTGERVVKPMPDFVFYQKVSDLIEEMNARIKDDEMLTAVKRTFLEYRKQSYSSVLKDLKRFGRKIKESEVEGKVEEFREVVTDVRSDYLRQKRKYLKKVNDPSAGDKEKAQAEDLADRMANMVNILDKTLGKVIKEMKDQQYSASTVLAREAMELEKQVAGLREAESGEKMKFRELLQERILVQKRLASQLEAVDLSVKEFKQVSGGDKHVLFIKGMPLASDIEDLIQEHNIGAFVTAEAGPTTHWVLAAKNLDVPVFFIRRRESDKLEAPSIGEVMAEGKVSVGELIIINGGNGTMVAGPDDMMVEIFDEQKTEEIALRRYYYEVRSERSVTGADAGVSQGTEIPVYANAEEKEFLLSALENGAYGVGLVRTEFWLKRDDHLVRKALTDGKDLEARKKLKEYLKANVWTLLKHSGSKPVTFRVIDAAEDKPLPGIDNRAYGVDFFRTPEGIRILTLQLEAIYETMIDHDVDPWRLKILFPQVDTAADIEDINKWINNCMAETVMNRAEGAEDGRDLTKLMELVQVGAMVESVESTEIIEKICGNFDFISIGTNDLIRSIFKEYENKWKVSNLRQTIKGLELFYVIQPEVLDRIERVVSEVARFGRTNKNISFPVTICGDAAALKEYQLFFMYLSSKYDIDLGLSLPPYEIPETKSFIRNFSGKDLSDVFRLRKDELISKVEEETGAVIKRIAANERVKELSSGIEAEEAEEGEALREEGPYPGEGTGEEHRDGIDKEPEHEDREAPSVEGSVLSREKLSLEVIGNLGLHARPAQDLARIMSKHGVSINILSGEIRTAGYLLKKIDSPEELPADGLEITDMMIGKGSVLQLEIEGEAPAEFIDELIYLEDRQEGGRVFSRGSPTLETITAVLEVNTSLGLHAIPATQLVKAKSIYGISYPDGLLLERIIRTTGAEEKVDTPVTNSMDLLMFGVYKGDRLVLRITGEDPEAYLEEVLRATDENAGGQRSFRAFEPGTAEGDESAGEEGSGETFTSGTDISETSESHEEDIRSITGVGPFQEMLMQAISDKIESTAPGNMFFSDDYGEKLTRGTDSRDISSFSAGLEGLKLIFIVPERIFELIGDKAETKEILRNAQFPWDVDIVGADLSGDADVTLRMVEKGYPEKGVMSVIMDKSSFYERQDAADVIRRLRTYIWEYSELIRDELLDILYGEGVELEDREKGVLERLGGIEEAADIAIKLKKGYRSYRLSEKSVIQMRLERSFMTRQGSGLYRRMADGYATEQKTGGVKRHIIHHADGLFIKGKSGSCLVPPGLEIRKRRAASGAVMEDDIYRDIFFITAPEKGMGDAEKEKFRKAVMEMWMLDGIVPDENVVILDRGKAVKSTSGLYAEAVERFGDMSPAGTGFRSLTGGLDYDAESGILGLLQLDVRSGASSNYEQYEALIALMLNRDVPLAELSVESGSIRHLRRGLYVFLPEASPVDLEERIRKYYELYTEHILIRA
jgi:phosphoenolpyruvate-protein kinase (PTS system EI component)/phosphotransferase system HPr-like phosphotransfer protein/glycerophosphoryl diester phosphodiesterase